MKSMMLPIACQAIFNLISCVFPSSFQTTYPIRKYIEPHEVVGMYDPLVNSHGEKLVSLNIERIVYYLGQGIQLDKPVSQLLGNRLSTLFLFGVNFGLTGTSRFITRHNI